MRDEDGLIWLDYLSELLENPMILSGLSEETLNLLKKHYHNWGAWDGE